MRRAVAEDLEERGEPPELSEEVVLTWADAFFERTGDWPKAESGEIPEAPGESWLLVAAALAFGLRGFPRGGSIARFLDEHRGRYNRADPKFTTEQVLAWADEWYRRTGDWPFIASGKIPGAGGATWGAVDQGLRHGRGMLPGGACLAQLLASERGVFRALPLTEEQILAWADAHKQRTGRWPAHDSGAITEAPYDTWSAVNAALIAGCRGLTGGTSLTELLVIARGHRSPAYAPRLTIPQILTWVDGFHARTGRWPNNGSGPVPDQPGESWMAVDTALARGCRGLAGGSTLTQLLIDNRGIRSQAHAPRLTTFQILAWADAFHARNGRWPEKHSGPIAEAPGESWRAIDAGLVKGHRGLIGGSSLARLLAQERGKRYAKDSRTVSVAEILMWADAFRQRHGAWPTPSSGPIEEAPGENWNIINNSLQAGRRGLPAGSSLRRLLAEHRGRRHIHEQPRFTIAQILRWADALHARTGQWPDSNSGLITESSTDTWKAVDAALKAGHRGLTGGSTLAGLLTEQRGRFSVKHRPKLTVSQILALADAFRERTGRWPDRHSGLIPESSPDTWGAVDAALKAGHRGLAGGSTLDRLLSEQRDHLSTRHRPDLTVPQILAWADAFQQRTGRWPDRDSGLIPESPQQTWRRVDAALREGRRGLGGGSSLTRLREARRKSGKR